MIVQIDSLRLVYTQTWKCASTSVYSLLRDILLPDEKSVPTAREHINKHHMVSPKDVCPDYYKFAVVRNPWSRMVSSFRECIKREPFGYGKGERAGCPEGGMSWPEIYDAMNGYISFEAFVDFVVDYEANACVPINRHWVPQHTYLKMRKIKYNKLCKIEQFDNDIQEVIKEANLPITCKKTYKEYSLKEYDWRLYYRYTDTIQKVARYYEKDIELFGYHTF